MLSYCQALSLNISNAITCALLPESYPEDIHRATCVVCAVPPLIDLIGGASPFPSSPLLSLSVCFVFRVLFCGLRVPGVAPRGVVDWPGRRRGWPAEKVVGG